MWTPLCVLRIPIHIFLPFSVHRDCHYSLHQSLLYTLFTGISFTFTTSLSPPFPFVSIPTFPFFSHFYHSSFFFVLLSSVFSSYSTLFLTPLFSPSFPALYLQDYTKHMPLRIRRKKIQIMTKMIKTAHDTAADIRRSVENFKH